MTHKLRSTLEASGIEWPALRNPIPCMAYIIQLALCAFICSVGVKGRIKSWEAHEHNPQFGKNECIDIGKSQRLRKKGSARINKMSAMRPGLARIIEKVRISTYFESPDSDFHVGENGCSIDYADTWASEWVHWLSKRQSMNCSTIYVGCEDTVEFDIGVARAGLPITRIHPRVAEESKIRWILATVYNTG